MKTVLTIDDDPTVRQLIKSVLAQNGSIQVIEAGDGKTGLEALRKYRPDLVLLDVKMPRQNGIDTLNHIRRDPELAAVPVILLTAYREPEKLLPYLENRHTDYMPKPFVISALRKKVNEVLNCTAGEGGNQAGR